DVGGDQGDCAEAKVAELAAAVSFAKAIAAPSPLPFPAKGNRPKVMSSYRGPRIAVLTTASQTMRPRPDDEELACASPLLAKVEKEAVFSDEETSTKVAASRD
ncbi:hypothetical protein ACHAWF_000518, partial [Thalassiosira exigua]